MLITTTSFHYHSKKLADPLREAVISVAGWFNVIGGFEWLL